MDFLIAHEQLLIQMCVFAVLAVSLQVVLRSGIFSLASIGFFSLGAYGAGIAAIHGWSLYPILLTVVVASFLGGYLFARPLRRLRGLYLGMATIAFSLVIPVLAINFGDWTGGSTGLYGIPLLVSLPHVAGALAVVAFIVAQLERGWAGRAQLCLRLDEGLARSVGLSVAGQRDFLFAVSTGIGGLAGALSALSLSIVTPTGSAGFGITTLALTMAVVGGRNSWLGAVLGAALLSWLPEWIRWLGAWQTAAYGLLLAVMVVVAPDGLLSLVTPAARRARALLPFGRERVAS